MRDILMGSHRIVFTRQWISLMLWFFRGLHGLMPCWNIKHPHLCFILLAYPLCYSGRVGKVIFHHSNNQITSGLWCELIVLLLKERRFATDFRCTQYKLRFLKFCNFSSFISSHLQLGIKVIELLVIWALLRSRTFGRMFLTFWWVYRFIWCFLVLNSCISY